MAPLKGRGYGEIPSAYSYVDACPVRIKQKGTYALSPQQLQLDKLDNEMLTEVFEFPICIPAYIHAVNV